MKLTQFNLLDRILKNMAPYYYAVAKGRNPGIYNTWEQCKVQVHQFSGPVYKKFNSQEEAEDFIKMHKNFSTKAKNTDTIPTVRKRKSQAQESSKDDVKPVSKRRTILLDSVNTNTKKEISSRKFTMSDFNTDSDGYVNVYTDGACSSNGKSNAQAGIGVWFGDGHPLNVSEPVVGRPTNNNAEIQAATAAANQARRAGVEKLRINTDSEFLIKCAEDWMPKWKSNGWKTTSNQPVINKHELQEMERATSSLDVSYNYVRGHSGVRGNEMADRLARAGCSQYSKKY